MRLPIAAAAIAAYFASPLFAQVPVVEPNSIITQPQSAPDFARSADIAGDVLVFTSPQVFPSFVPRVAVYVLQATGEWALLQYLTAPSGSGAGGFGASVATNGATIAVGAPDSGLVHVFDRNQTTGMWEFSTSLTHPFLGSQVDFGRVVRVFGERIAVRNRDSAASIGNDSGWTVFERDPQGAWEHTVPDPLDKFQVDVTGGPNDASDIAMDGDLLAVSGTVSAGGNAAGRVYLFERAPNGWWFQVDRIERDDHVGFGGFGTALVLDGDRLFVGAPYSQYLGTSTGSVHVYDRATSGEWIESATIVAPPPTLSTGFGRRLTQVGQSLFVSRGSGAVQYEESAPGTWSDVARIEVPSPLIYTDVHRASGDRLVLANPEQFVPFGSFPGSVYIFETVTLRADTSEVSIGGDRTQSLALRMGNQWSGTPYFMLGSLSGTAPGTLVDLGFASATLPLNFDAYTMLCLDGQAPIGGQVGLLDQFGAADAVLQLPANLDPVFVGITVNHAAVVANWFTPLLAVTNAVGAVIVP